MSDFSDLFLSKSEKSLSALLPRLVFTIFFIGICMEVSTRSCVVTRDRIMFQDRDCLETIKNSLTEYILRVNKI